VGYDAATVEAIAIRADLTRPAVNYYFPSKLALYREVIERISARVVATCIERAAGETTLRGQLSAFIAATVRAHSEDRSAAAVLLTSALESRRHPEVRDLDHRAVADTRAFLTGAIKAAIKRGEISAHIDATALVEMLAAVLCGVGFYAAFIGSHQQLEAVTAQLRRLVVDGLWCISAQPTSRQQSHDG
jgi:AcrR family transcriptional regulator